LHIAAFGHIPAEKSQCPFTQRFEPGRPRAAELEPVASSGRSSPVRRNVAVRRPMQSDLGRGVSRAPRSAL